MLRRNNLKLQGFALDRLQWYREFLKAPIVVNHAHLKYRGWRSTAENANLGYNKKKGRVIKGVPDSPHVQGIAFDMNCYSAELSQFAIATVAYSLEQAKKTGGNPNHRGFRGIGIYPRQNFIHGDFRSFTAKSEDYVVLWNGDVDGALILKERDLPRTLPGLLDLLKKELHLPRNWRL